MTLKKLLPIPQTFQDEPLMVKDPLPPNVLKAIDVLNTYIVTRRINWTSRRQEVRKQTQRQLVSFVMALDALSFAEFMEQQEAKRKYAPKPVQLPEPQKRSA